MPGLIDRDSRPLSEEHKEINQLLGANNIVTIPGEELLRRGVEAIYIEYNWQEGSTHNVYTSASIRQILLDPGSGHMKIHYKSPTIRPRSFQAKYLLDVTFIRSSDLARARPNFDTIS